MMPRAMLAFPAIRAHVNERSGRSAFSLGDKMPAAHSPCSLSPIARCFLRYLVGHGENCAAAH